MAQDREDPADNIRMFVESARAVVPDDGSVARARAARFHAPGYSRDIWTTLADMGWLGVREAVQMHGAIGYTDEADIGLYVRKLMVEAGQFAPEYRLRRQFMDLREATA